MIFNLVSSSDCKTRKTVFSHKYLYSNTFLSQQLMLKAKHNPVWQKNVFPCDRDLEKMMWTDRGALSHLCRHLCLSSCLSASHL